MSLVLETLKYLRPTIFFQNTIFIKIEYLPMFFVANILITKIVAQFAKGVHTHIQLLEFKCI